MQRDVTDACLIDPAGLTFSAWQVPCAGRQVVEANQVHPAALTVLRDRQQIVDALEAGLARQVVGNVFLPNRLDRLDHDVAVVHLVAAAGLDVRTRPDANAAPDAPAPDALA